MSEEPKPILEQQIDALNRIADNLELLNDAIFTLAAESIDTADTLKALNTKIDKLLSEPLKVIVDFKQFTESLQKATPKPAESLVTEYTAPPLEG